MPRPSRKHIRPPFVPDADNRIREWWRQVAAFVNNQRFGDVKGSDYAEFEDDGTLRLYGDATAFKDITLDLAALPRGASAPDIGVVGGGTINHLLFDGANTIEEIHGHTEIAHDVKMTTLSPHIHWLPTTTATGDVKWNLTYAIANAGGTYAETTISVIDAAAGSLVAHVVAFPDIDISNYTQGAQLSFKLYRDPGDTEDTYGDDAAAITIGFHVEVQSLGTRTQIVD